MGKRSENLGKPVSNIQGLIVRPYLDVKGNQVGFVICRGKKIFDGADKPYKSAEIAIKACQGLFDNKYAQRDLIAKFRGCTVRELNFKEK